MTLMSCRSTLVSLTGSITFMMASTHSGERMLEYCETTCADHSPQITSRRHYSATWQPPSQPQPTQMVVSISKYRGATQHRDQTFKVSTDDGMVHFFTLFLDTEAKSTVEFSIRHVSGIEHYFGIVRYQRNDGIDPALITTGLGTISERTLELSAVVALCSRDSWSLNSRGIAIVSRISTHLVDARWNASEITVGCIPVNDHQSLNSRNALTITGHKETAEKTICSIQSSHLFLLPVAAASLPASLYPPIQHRQICTDVDSAAISRYATSHDHSNHKISPTHHCVNVITM